MSNKMMADTAIEMGRQMARDGLFGAAGVMVAIYDRIDHPDDVEILLKHIRGPLVLADHDYGLAKFACDYTSYMEVLG